MAGLGRHSTFALALLVSTLTISPNLNAGGGMVLQDDVCTLEIGFYSAHFTVYQPTSQGNTEFCQSFPDTGETLFVLDYLHNSMQEVPIDFRIIRDTSGLGEYVQLTDVEALEDLQAVTELYQPPVVQRDASLRISHHFDQAGDYIGIVTAGHPSNGKTYSAVFPFSVAQSNYTAWFAGLLLLIPLAYFGMRKRAHT